MGLPGPGEHGRDSGRRARVDYGYAWDGDATFAGDDQRDGLLQQADAPRRSEIVVEVAPDNDGKACVVQVMSYETGQPDESQRIARMRAIADTLHEHGLSEAPAIETDKPIRHSGLRTDTPASGQARRSGAGLTGSRLPSPPLARRARDRAARGDQDSGGRRRPADFRLRSGHRRRVRGRVVPSLRDRGMPVGGAARGRLPADRVLLASPEALLPG